MEKTEPNIAIITLSRKEETDWAKCLDYNQFFVPAEINNISLDLFKKDFEL
ncbi:MAG: hypothetical protein ACXAAH_05460 [Promethearchaeota archaeon]|jgi:hypothetical protein